SMQGFAKVATNGTLWRLSLGNAHYFNGALHRFKDSLPVIKKWSAFKELPQIKGNLYQQIQKLQGVHYD
ncbi:lactate utilisation protein LutB domain-containing protein, partial [Helicobacter sp. UBA3407]